MIGSILCNERRQDQHTLITVHEFELRTGDGIAGCWIVAYLATAGFWYNEELKSLMHAVVLCYYDQMRICWFVAMTMQRRE